MYTINNLAKTLRNNGINVVAVHESTDWQVEDNEIQLDNQIYLQVDDESIGVYRANSDYRMTCLGYYEEVTYSLIHKLITLTT
jgi:hypothetical protein